MPSRSFSRVYLAQQAFLDDLILPVVEDWGQLYVPTEYCDFYPLLFDADGLLPWSVSGAPVILPAYDPSNGYGLLDVTGNAFEWTRDVYVFDPTIDREQVGQFHADGAEAYRVLRGGSFVLDGVYLRNSFRMRLRPDVRTDDIGFRVLREAAPGSRKEQR